MPEFPSRCQHIKVNGTQCGSPALRRNKLCFFHKRFHSERIDINKARARRRAAIIDLPVLEDANSIQVSLMQIMRLLALGHIDPKTAGLLLYALQTASANLRRTDFEPRMHKVVLDPRTVGDTLLGENIWEDDDFAEEEDEEDEEAARAEALEEAKRKLEKQAKLDRWAEQEANRLAREGAAERAREEKAEAARDQLRRDEAAKREAELASYEAARTKESQIKQGARRPPGNVTIEEVREKVKEQVIDALKKGLLPTTG